MCQLQEYLTLWEIYFTHIVMNAFFQISTRDKMIGLGNMLGTYFKHANREKPWMITLDGDVASGKALIALAIDQAIHPDMYLTGLEPYHSADVHLSPERQHPIVFQNFGNIISPTQEKFDQRLCAFEEAHPHAKILIGSNHARHHTDHFNYQARGLHSDRLDMNIHVEILRPGTGLFERKIVITAQDEKLCKVLIAAMETPNLLPIVPTIPSKLRWD